MPEGSDASKFGLTSSELLEALDFLESKGMKDCLKLIHFHIGSQITKIRRIQTALREAAQFYVQLHKMGYNVDFVDCGGGLGVDYDGTRSSNSESLVPRASIVAISMRLSSPPERLALTSRFI